MIPQQAQHPPTSRRHPLAPADTNAPAAPASPPLPRQNSKTTPPSPPKIIADKSGRQKYQRVGFLGEGGFARVYEIMDSSTKRLACKVVTMSSLKTKKAKTKLYAEIKIHRSLSHPNIVKFIDCFEGDDNVYITLELCTSGSLMDLLRRRKRFTEPEARFFMVQLIGACQYMHNQSVIHRDLKLGNLFLDGHMNVKVGDFGLAALIESPGERKKTICGTPNYIAPEVLFDTASGHSFEVDTWSIGVILYTLVVGRPPFQTKDVKAIYQKIRNNDYSFPAEPPASPSMPSRKLIGDILTQDPAQRPTLQAIVSHQWFAMGPVPPYIPTSAHDSPPDWSHITRERSDYNFTKLKRQVGLDGHEEVVAQSNVDTKNTAATVARQEYEFQKAVQPGSPISALLSSARQPLVRGVGGSPLGQSQGRPPIPGYSNPPAQKEGGLYRKLQAANVKSPLRNSTAAHRALDNIVEEDGGQNKPVKDRRKAKNETELESQKARIVVQMAPTEEKVEHRAKVEERVKVQDRVKPVDTLKSTYNRVPLKEQQENLPPIGALRKPKPLIKEVPVAKMQPQSPFLATYETLNNAFIAYSRGQLPAAPEHQLRDERVFIVSWVDYCNKYGMGYALTDRSVGVYFNDSTTLVLSADKVHFEYLTPTSSSANASPLAAPSSRSESYTVDHYPAELESKVYLLKHFERYIMDRLYADYNYTYEDTERTKGMDWVVKYLRMKHVMVFLMSHGALQYNFFDHSKVIISSNGHAITHIDKYYNVTKWSLRQLLRAALTGMAGVDKEEAKLINRLVSQLKYCKEVLLSIQVAGAKVQDAGMQGVEDVADFQADLMRKASKGGLRV
ncbi:Serine/threonine-protein kinase [Mycena indigotica]|uniref:Serine/threonine-protein kinase n=1 Tax=Mycena indigotica TaxID=2126181 RepID=A0A8H6W1E2_9AGAR|nr:Serine/threonine-protein kinase [Mycena indigotica]KAF7301457.1 Serine/threonine-protein kinase [Mycena indigotica]